MVSLDGKIPSFRITREELLELVSQIERKMVAELNTIRKIDVTLGNFSQECKNATELSDFLKDIFLPKVVKEGNLFVFGAPEKTSFGLIFGESRASYRVIDAKDTGQARSYEDIIKTFFTKHRVSPIFNQSTPLFLSSPIIIALFAIVYPLVRSVFSGTSLQYSGVYLFGAICVIVFALYIIWSNSTEDTPSASFFHSIIWIEEPKSKVAWAFASSILGGLFVSFIFQLLS